MTLTSHITPAKHLGQHFLNNPRTIARIADSIEACLTDSTQPSHIAEIGPGAGALTRELLARGHHVLAIEMDDRCHPLLEDLSAQHNNRLTLIKGDALQLETWLPQLPAASPICGNLPYNVGTEIVTRLLLHPYQSHTYPTTNDTPTAGPNHSRHPREGGDPRYKTSPNEASFSPLIFMLQKEVVQRLTSTGGEHWGRLGVITHLLANARKLFDVGPGNFTPPPKVMSSIVKIEPLASPRYTVNLHQLDTLLRASFGQRRKMLRGSLKGLLTEAHITAVGINPTARPEELTTEQLCTLANALLATDF